MSKMQIKHRKKLTKVSKIKSQDYYTTRENMKQDHVRVEEGHMLNESEKRTCENCLFSKKYEDYEGFFKCLKNGCTRIGADACKHWAPAK